MSCAKEDRSSPDASDKVQHTGRFESRTREQWRKLILNSRISFETVAMQVFHYQLKYQPVYQKFCDAFTVEPASIEQIPLIPVQVFRDTRIRAASAGLGGKSAVSTASSGPGQQLAVSPADNPDEHPDTLSVSREPGEESATFCSPAPRDPNFPTSSASAAEAVFRSSGTTGAVSSVHEIADLTLYLESCYRGFSCFYSPPEWTILVYLPGYSENPSSSLIAMMEHLTRRDPLGKSRFLSLNPSRAREELQQTGKEQRRIMLFGAAFGLLELVEEGKCSLPPDSIVVETGGMKTRRREIDRETLHQVLARGLGLPLRSIHSEYGMAEMCSQAWDPGTGWFQTPPWLQITIRDPQNPLKTLPAGSQGLVGVMDLANVHSLSFFLTQDKGVAREKGDFQVLGRWDDAELRGCNFLME